MTRFSVLKLEFTTGCSCVPARIPDGEMLDPCSPMYELMEPSHPQPAFTMVDLASPDILAVKAKNITMRTFMISRAKLPSTRTYGPDGHK
jgi:hypothetical protein